MGVISAIESRRESTKQLVAFNYVCRRRRRRRRNRQSPKGLIPMSRVH